MTCTAASRPSSGWQSRWFALSVIQSVVFCLGWNGAAIATGAIGGYLLQRGFSTLLPAAPGTSAEMWNVYTASYKFVVTAAVSGATVFGLARLRKRITGTLQWAGVVIAGCLIVYALHFMAQALSVAPALRYTPLAWYMPMEAAVSWPGGFVALSVFAWLLRVAAPCAQGDVVSPMANQGTQGAGGQGSVATQFGASPPLRARVAWLLLCWSVFVVVWDTASALCVAPLYFMFIMHTAGRLYVSAWSLAVIEASIIGIMPIVFKGALAGVYAAAWQWGRAHNVDGVPRLMLVIAAAIGTAALRFWLYSTEPDMLIGLQYDIVLVGASTIAAIYVLDLFGASVACSLRQGLVAGWPQ